MNYRNLLKLLVCVAISESAGIIGSFFTISSIEGWYTALHKPFLSPPNWIFGPVWVILYVLMGVAAFLIWKKGWENKEVKAALAVFGLQLVLNTLWSIIFFGLHSPGLAFAEIMALWLAIIWTIVIFYKISRTAAWLLAPYILWVSFAAYLNFSIWMLN